MTRLLRLDLKCPRCGKPPRLRITEAERDRAFAKAPGEVIGTYQCHHCNHIYDMPAAACQRAA